MTMIDGGKNRKDFMSIVYETYKDFAENTSIHGLKYTVKSDIALCEKIFWIIVVLAGLAGSAYMTVLFWNRYQSNPTRTSILTTYAPTTSIPFPAVTICGINRIVDSKVKDFVNKMDVDEDEREIVERALPQLLAFAIPEKVKYNQTDLELLHTVLTRNEFTDIRHVMRRISPACSEILMKCRWNFTDYKCSDLFEESMTLDGKCCSFNSITFKKKKQAKYTVFNGFNSGLIALIYLGNETKQHLSLHSSGVKVLIHHPGDYPGVGSITKVVSGGRQSYMQVVASKIICGDEIRKLSIYQRQCAFSEEVDLRYFRPYADSNCLTECDVKFYYKKCGCVPYFLDFAVTENGMLRECDCPSQCEDDIYNVLSTSTVFKEAVKGLTSNLLANETITDSKVLVQVYFLGQRQTIYFRDVITSTIYLLSSMGGVYSLFLGCSFITIVEIIYYCWFRFLVNSKLYGQVMNNTTAVTDDTRRRNAVRVKHQEYDRNIFLN